MKINKIILAGIMSLALAGCSSSNQQEIDPIDLLDTANETTTSSDISETTTVSETISEETESETTTEYETTTTTEETTTTSEITTTSEVTTTEETTTAAEVVTEVDSDGNAVLKMTADTKFYECKLTDENSVTSAEEFADKELLDKTVEFLKASDFYADIYQQICTAAKEQGYTDLSECNPECELINAITDDFNYDGKEETAFLFSVNKTVPVTMWANFGMNRCVLFADSDGNISMTNEEFSEEAQMAEIKYSGFSHLVVSGGHNNISYQVCIYSVQESGLKKEFNDDGSPGISEDSSLEFALRIGFPQSSADYLIFWNEDLKCYVTPKAKYISGDDAKEIKSHMELSEDDKSRVEDSDIMVIGNYYTLYSSPLNPAFGYVVTYEYKNGEYLRMELVELCEAQGDRGTYGVIFCDNLDIETAEKNLVKID